jgi:hypothetical protein
MIVVSRLTLLLIIACSLLFVLAPKADAFDFFRDPCAASPKSSKSSVCQDTGNAKSDTAGNNSVLRTINAGANIIAVLAGVLAVGMIIWGGFKFVTAGGAPGGQRAGDPSKAKDARDTVTAALIGLVVIVLAWTLTRFVIDKVIQ